MMESDCEDQNVLKVKEYLNKNKIKLWLPPFFSTNDTIDENEILKLSQEIRTSLKIELNIVVECINVLQSKSLENIKKRTTFETTGVATLKLRPSTKGGEIIDIETSLKIRGYELRALVAGKLHDKSNQLKLISKGKVVNDELTLEEQNIKHGMQIMVLILSDNIDKLRTFEQCKSLIDTTKQDVATLSDGISKRGDRYLQITDQSGNSINLPPKEEKALVLAMALHERGRSAMKDGNFDLALFLLLEAEKEFGLCNSSILDHVDNYGLLSLDIAWCYLCLQSLKQLPDAQARLIRCEQVFEKSYGKNCERLQVLKGSTSNEGVLFLRLHLLQAIVLYHEGKCKESSTLLNTVEEDLKILKVDDELISQMVNLGYDIQESRLALRQSGGNINDAVTIIEKKREDRIRQLENQKKEKEINMQRRKLGKCDDGSWVEPQFHQALTSMGYTYQIAKWALARTNNRISDAVAYIQDHPNEWPDSAISEDNISMVSSMGFDERQAEDALKRHNGNVEAAIEDLVMNRSLASQGTSAGTSSRQLQSLIDIASTSKEYSEEKKKRKEAMSRLTDGVTESGEDYLDIELNAEEEFLNRYKSLIAERESSM